MAWHWHSVAAPWLNHGWTMAKSCRNACMWAGQRVLCLLQNLFKQSKLSLTLTLARAKCWGSCSDYNWDPWAPHIALHASWNVSRCLKHLETVQAIEHSVVVNGCKNNGNSYYWSQVTTMLIRRSMKSTYTLYGTPSKFYPSPRTWRHYASRPLISYHSWLCPTQAGLALDGTLFGLPGYNSHVSPNFGQGLALHFH